MTIQDLTEDEIMDLIQACETTKQQWGKLTTEHAEQLKKTGGTKFCFNRVSDYTNLKNKLENIYRDNKS